MIKMAKDKTQALEQIVEIWRDQEREGESRTPKYLKEKTRFRGLLLIVRGG